MSLVQQVSSINPQNTHFRDPGMSSNVGAISGYKPAYSDLSLQQKNLYSDIMTGGKRRKNSRKHGKKQSRKHVNKHGKKHSRKHNRKIHRGGNGYGFSQNQVIDGSYSGNGSVHLPNYSNYQNTNLVSDTNINSYKQNGGGSYGTGGNPFYSYKPIEGENLSLFAGSGYPPISKGLNSQCGGKKHKSKKQRFRKTHSSKSKKHRKSRKHRKSYQHGGITQYMNNVANSHTFSVGPPHQLNHTSSALANPPPFTSTNNCVDTYKHFGGAGDDNDHDDKTSI